MAESGAMSLARTREPFDAIDRRIAESLFDALRRQTADTVGVRRDSYGRGETIALAIVERCAQELGLATCRDAGANLVVTLEGRDPTLPFVACGSHLDSVPQGGNYDGAAGVIAALLVLADFRRRGFIPRQSIKLLALRGEESARFGRAYVGSSALLGGLAPADLQLEEETAGRTLGDCMRDVGVDVERVAAGQPLLDPKTVGAWIELHIEQGPVLHARQLPIAVVTGIRGNLRHRSVTCVGEPGHSGAVPRWLRRDAVFATAELITHLDRHWRTLLERGRDLVVTAGVLGTDAAEHAIARIPGTVRFSMEFRSQSAATLEAVYDLFLSECQMLAEERGVEFSLDRRLETRPAVMDPAWVARLKDAARRQGLPDEELPSGAGHDAAVFANAGIPSAMIFVRNEHGSHNPNEAMEMDDFLRATAVMRAAIEEAAT